MASLKQPSANVITAVKGAVATSDVSNISVTDPDSCAGGATSVTVTVTADFKYIALWLFPGPHQITGKATAPC